MHVSTLCMQDFFIQNLQSVGLYTESLQQLLEVLSKDCHMLFSFLEMQYLIPDFSISFELLFIDNIIS